MKKRILALALAGTTAFSVFGMAVSAAGDSTHVDFANDAYEPYEAVAPLYSDGAYTFVNLEGNGTASDAVLSRNGETVDPETVYAYDYFGHIYDVNNFMDAFEDAEWFRVEKNGNVYYSAREDVAELIKILKEDNDTDLEVETYSSWNYNDVRAEVVYEYVDFLAELGLIKYTTTNGIVTTGKGAAAITGAWVYKYEDKNGKKVDLYNFEGLAADIAATVDAVVKGYNRTSNNINLASSQMAYLMQQYDKYTDGFYAYGYSETVWASEWAELLISALEAVSEDDFNSTYAYKAFAKNANAAIEAYELYPYAQNTDAIKALYNAVVAQYGRSAGSDKTELAATINGLYFNNKNIPDTYMPAAVGNSNVSDLYLYGYKEANAVVDASVITSGTYAKAVYPVYPMADYADLDKLTPNAVYPGNKNDGNFEGKWNTAEYEWFWNVYQLATTVNELTTSGSYQGVIDTVNAALEDAVAALAPTATPYGSTALRLDEAVEKYEGAIESDYVAKYYNAYTKAHDIAENVEGDLATKYAIEMVITTGVTLGYQSTQTTITKGEIRDLTADVKAATDALKAIKADKEKYNASQILALNDAIDAANALIAIYNGNHATVIESVNKEPVTYTGDKDQILKSQIVAASEAIDAAINYQETVQGWSKNADGAWQYGEGGEYFQDGWKKIGATWYYFEDGAAVQSDWRKIDGNWYYLNSNCGAAYGWCKVDGDWYYFNGDNTMKTGWLKKEGAWYYLAASGKMVTGKQVIDGVEYTFSTEANALGQML